MLINIRCYEEQGMPPYCPWVQAIRSYVREHEPDQLRSEMGAGAADIAEVVSDVREVLPDLKPPPVHWDSGTVGPARGGFSRNLSNSLVINGLSGPRPLRVCEGRWVIT